jgi:FtsP/CotA-like multicopper oxidase with cupredoxin domain
MLTRRRFAIGCGAIASTAVVGARFGLGQAAPFSTHLPIPTLIDAASQGGAVKLRAARGRHTFLRGKPTLTYGYSAPILGPVLRVRRGDEVEMAVENALDVPTTVHWHGLLAPGDVDGGPQQPINPGRTWRPILKVNQPAATLWYHPHPHHDTARQIYMGMAGMLIVADDTESRLGVPHTFGVDDLPIILQDRSFDSDGSLDYDPGPLDIVYGARGDTVIVNGVIAPFARVPPGLVRLRFLNAANAQNFKLRFRDRRTFFVIASDAGFLAAPVAVTQLRISSAERFEVLVDFADRRSVVLETGPDELMGIFGVISDAEPDKYVPIMRFEPTAAAPAIHLMPKQLVEPAAANPARAVRRRQLVLNNGIFAPNANAEAHEDAISLVGINGRAFDIARIDVETKLGTSEIWEIVSVGMAHPFHVHGASFRILSLKGAPPPAHLAGWKDVALVDERAELLVVFNQPATRDHPFMYHCHILEHEDAGMMGQYVCA